MSIAEHRAARLLAAAALLTIATTAAAQQPAPAQKPAAAPKPAPAHNAQAPAAPAAPAPAVGQAPQRTSATYGDWEVVCEMLAGPPAQKSCDMQQILRSQGNPISRVALPLPPKGESVKLFVQLPVNVSFTAPVKITIDDKDAGFTTPFRRCVPAGCFAEAELKDDLQKKFRAANETGKMIFRDAGDHDVTLPLSFKGFAQAYEALLKQ
jgi:invasion protein IalB